MSERQMLVANSGVVTLLTQPRHNGRPFSQLLLLEGGQLIEERSGWNLLELPDGSRGWVRASQLSSADREMELGQPSMVVERFAPVLETPRYGGRVRTYLPLGTRLNVQDMAGDFVVVEVPRRGKSGTPTVTCFMAKNSIESLNDSGEAGAFQPGQSRRLVVDQSISNLADRAAGKAYDLLGTPFLQGGCTTYGLNDVGLVRLAYLAGAGLELPRERERLIADRRFQPLSGQPPELELIAGDLLAFGREGRLTGVGIVLDDEQRFAISRRSTDGVRERSVLKTKLMLDFRGAYRLTRSKPFEIIH